MGQLLFHDLQIVEGKGAFVLAIALDEDGLDGLEIEFRSSAEAIPFEPVRSRSFPPSSGPAPRSFR